MSDVTNALSFDVEDWYMGIEIGLGEWGRYEKRLATGLVPILDLLARYRTKGTFFVLGRCAEEHPALIKRIADEGHEIGTHGYSHSKVYDLTPREFEDELASSVRILREVTGKAPTGFRAPYFSITKQSRWALGMLPKYGISYDASIYPGANWRYGIEGSPEHPYMLDEPRLAEFPVSVGKFAGRKVGLGGAYFRILPYPVTRYFMRRLNRAGRAAMFYLHPWEFDPGQPRIRLARRKAELTHYFRLGVTLPRFERLLRDFRFSTVSDVLRGMGLLNAAAVS